MFESTRFLQKVIRHQEADFKSANQKKAFYRKAILDGGKVSETQIKTAGIGPTIIFLVILSNESLLSIGRHESLELSVSRE